MIYVLLLALTGYSLSILGTHGVWMSRRTQQRPPLIWELWNEGGRWGYYPLWVALRWGGFVVGLAGMIWLGILVGQST